MALSAAVRRAVASAACSAARASVKGRPTARFYSAAAGLSRPLLRPASELRRESIRALPTFRLMATASDTNLLRVIDAEIEVAVESGDHEQADDIPNKFPFEINDVPGTSNVVLTRDFHGEQIEVVVSMPNVDEDDDDSESDSQDDEKDNENQPQSSLPLVVKVSKGNGPILEFYCTAFADEVQIESLFFKDVEDVEEDLSYDGPEFSDLDENLQKAFHKYLEIRGISPATTNFLHEYMVNKDSREYLVWMKKLKEFVAK